MKKKKIIRKKPNLIKKIIRTRAEIVGDTIKKNYNVTVYFPINLNIQCIYIITIRSTIMFLF